MSRLRLALFTPLNPLRSGISDHCEELLPCLGARADVDVVIDDYQPSNRRLREEFRIISPAEFLAGAASYDAAIYQIGNNLPQHAYMIPCLRRAGGIVVLQDYCLQHLVLGVTAGQGDVRPLVSALAHRHGDRAAALARRLVLSRANPNEYSFVAFFAGLCDAFMVHSEHMLALVRQDSPDVPSRFVPMGVTMPRELPPTDGLRRRYGLSDDDFVMASLSTLSAAKRTEVLFEALAAVKREHPRVRLLIVGGGQLGADAQGLVERLDLGANVIRTGWVSSEDYANLTALSDLVLDLRQTTGAETPNSLLRALGAGKAAVVTGYGAFLELPDSCCLKVPIAPDQADILGAAIRGLIEDPSRRRRMADAARRFALASLTLDQTADGYVDLVRELREQGGARRTIAPAAPPPRPVRMAVSSAYKLCRVGYLYNQYGVRGALRRVGSAIRARA
jgi:glycosyltransferase involved in cell wall biosynthesis